MFKKTHIILIVIFFLSSWCSAADDHVNTDDERGVRIMFYNVENLFDVFDDSLTLDDEFLPSSDKHWTKKRYEDKIRNIYKVIAAVGGYEPPEIVALCEVENKTVLYDLIRNTPLSKYPYKIIHKESPDRRGIDVAILYRTDKLDLLAREFIRIRDPGNSGFRTRDIVYVKVVSDKSDTLHVFANHWPSRRGGIHRSESKRVLAATVLRDKIDSLVEEHENPAIVITGDFNDDPDNKSILEILIRTGSVIRMPLINLSMELKEECKCGTLKYKGNWNMFDQFIVSEVLLSDRHGLQTSINNLHIYNVDFLLEDDEKYFGQMPYRTYNGYRYIDGYSDHLPVYLDLVKKGVTGNE